MVDGLDGSNEFASMEFVAVPMQSSPQIIDCTRDVSLPSIPHNRSNLFNKTLAEEV